jgi:3-hydroxyisobutyrate dehydrogenase-like beta-hydroxyacid dehydrogenase
MKDGCYIFDMSTIDPSTTKKMAALANAKGVHFLDCPLSGGPFGAAAGTLSTIIGASDEEF